jgi:intracellular multiplication protein IcmD
LIVKSSELLKRAFYFFLVAGCAVLFAQVASATQTIGSVAENITDTFGQLAQLITAGSYIAGLGFAVGAIMKFKAHKDNPTQIPVGTPIALLFIAAALIFLPSIFKISGQTLFGSSASAAGISGITDFD